MSSASPDPRVDGRPGPAPAQTPAAPERLRPLAAQLKTLYHMGRDLGEDENWSDALDRFLMALVSFMEAEGAGLLLLSDGTRSLSARAVFHLDEGHVGRAIDTIRDGWTRHARAAEIHALESYGSSRPTSCLERTAAWRTTVIPLRHRGRALGFLILDKAYRRAHHFQGDYLFLSTLQTIFAEEIANASYISELRQLSRFNHKVLDNLRSGVVTTDLDGAIRFANAWAAEMCPRLRGRGSAGTVHMDELFQHAIHGGLFRRLLEAADDAEGLEVTCHGGRAPFPVRLRVTKMHDDNINGTVLVAIFDDLSEMKRMEEAVRRNDRLRALGQLSAGVAHEIRNPLAGIATTAEVLGEKLAGDDDKVRYIHAMLDEIQRLDGIVKNLLAFARPPKPQLSRCGVADVAARVVSLSADAATARGVVVATSVDADVICLADPSQLTQVLLNLVLNAVQACGHGDRVAVAARRDEGWVAIEVADTGAGVAEEVRATLFDPFVSTKTQGTGLGLAISRQIVDDHAGTIACEFLEKGTKFTVRLPALAVPVAGAPA
ncbi:MAG TPA: ATP-binding protein [Candidatus Krumholzibacteria bacterium]|nr:ATP-binding protein [Candidatus Krumholzibacteria bacterium]